MLKTESWFSEIEKISFVNYGKNEIMTTVDLKQSLLDEISKIENHEFFEAMKVFMDFRDCFEFLKK